MKAGCPARPNPLADNYLQLLLHSCKKVWRLGLHYVDKYSIMGNMTTQWVILKRWNNDGWTSPWQPACQIMFDTQEQAEARKLELEFVGPGREFKVVEQKRA